MKKLFQFFKKKPLVADLYPELSNMSGLKIALNSEFLKINSRLSVSDDHALLKMPITYARVEMERKFSQIYLAANEKLYLPDFWRDGVCLAHGKTDDLRELAKALNFWLCED